MDIGVLAQAVELSQARQPFVLATVVWRRGPSSGHHGSKAVICADGSVRGWLGGACAEPTVVRHGVECLATGEPALLFLGEPDEGAGGAPSPHDSDAAPTPIPRPFGEGVRHVAMACESEGALEIYLEPHSPPPQVVVVGRSPAVDALASMAVALGWSATIVDDGGDADTHDSAARVGVRIRTKLDLEGLGIDAATAVVVATQGHYDDLALTAAIATDAGYVGLVASAKRAEAVKEFLADGGADRAGLERVIAPAGMDLGPLRNAEIAAAIMADLVARRARGDLAAAAAPIGAEPRREAIDPVCGMTVLIADAKYHTVFETTDYWFCASGCLRAFESAPFSFVGS